MLKILLIEDDLDLAGTVVDFLALENIRCDHAASGISGIELMQHEDFDVLLLDLNLPQLDGLSVCKKLREDGDDTPVLMLTARHTLAEKLEGFSAGSDDYLVKPFALEELLARIQVLARRKSGQARRLEYHGLSLDLESKAVSRDELPIKLSPTGFRLLEILLREAPSVVTRQELESKLWGDDPPESNSLKVHMYNLRKAVDSPFAHPLIHTVTGYGFAIRTEDE